MSLIQVQDYFSRECVVETLGFDFHVKYFSLIHTSLY